MIQDQRVHERSSLRRQITVEILATKSHRGTGHRGLEQSALAEEARTAEGGNKIIMEREHLPDGEIDNHFASSR
jgi:hypothetical protein